MNLKDARTYTENELEMLTTKELECLANECDSLEGKFNTEQMALKILINSLYGALANKWFLLFNESMAQAITGNGRYFIRMLARNIENKLQSLIKWEQPYLKSGDTDSVYYSVAPFVEMFKAKNPEATLTEIVDWVDEFEKQVIQTQVRKTIAEFSKILNAYNSEIIGAEREVIADCAVFAKKKKYFMRVRDSEGTRYPDDEPYIKIMGLEAIKSSTPTWSVKYLKQAIPKILDGTEHDIRIWVQQLRENFASAPLPTISTVGGVSRLDYDLNEGSVPFGSRAAIRHNNFVLESGLQDKYQMIEAGDKCKRLHLITPNRLKTEIVAYISDQFVEEIKDIIDLDTQFEKGFTKQLGLMTHCLNYNLDKETQDLDDW